MNVLHISGAKTWRGGEQQIAYLWEELNRASDIRQFIAVPIGSPLESFCLAKKIAHLSYNKRSSIHPGIARSIYKYCKQNQIDLIHVHDSHAHTFAVLSATLFGNNAPIVLTRRVDFPIQKSYLSRWKYNHHSIKKVVCISKKIKEVLSVDIKQKDNIEVIYSGVDINRFKINIKGKDVLRTEFNIPNETAIIGNVAALAPHKDLPTFIKTAEKILNTKKDVHFFLIGKEDGSEAEVKDLIQQKNLGENITLTGFRNDIPAVLHSLDLFLMTSKEEGLGTSLLDAMAAKIPIVATEAGGIPEIIIDHKTGLTAPIGDSTKLSECCIKILSDKKLREVLIRQASDFVKSFSKQEMGAKYQKLYHNILLKHT